MAGTALASAPAALVGAWVLAGAMLDHVDERGVSAPTGTTIAWQLRLVGFGGESPLGGLDNLFGRAVLGLLLLLPALLLSLVVSRAWAEAFARARARELDGSWALVAWLFVLLLPAGTPWYLVATGLSFGLVFGSHVYGGTGRSLVNPALLGALFLLVAYPDHFAAGSWVPGTDLAATWNDVSNSPPGASGVRWTDAFVGVEVGALGTGSAAACALGALVLIGLRQAAWRPVAGAIAGLVLAGSFATEVPWHWHPVLGYFAFVTAFVLTDPTTRARTVFGQWSQGVSFGVLTVVIRTADPLHPEGTLFAALLATLATPLFDHIAGHRGPAVASEAT